MEKMKLYHGTSSIYLDSILENGLLPRKDTGNSNYEVQDVWGANYGLESYFDRVYLTNSPEKANLLGKQAVDINGGEVIVLEVLVDKEKLLPDEDSNKQTWQASLLEIKSVAYKGNISPDKIKPYNIPPNMIPVYKTLDKL